MAAEALALGVVEVYRHLLEQGATAESIPSCRKLQCRPSRSCRPQGLPRRALKRLHSVAKAGEGKGVPIDFLKDLIDHEWNHAEKNGGKTFMGNVVKGLTRSIMNTQNKVLYGNDRK